MPSMSRRLLIVLFAMTLHNRSVQTLDKYADQLYFEKLSLNPETSITEFLKRYVPVVFKKMTLQAVELLIHLALSKSRNFTK
jgi:hypothetical protein